MHRNLSHCRRQRQHHFDLGGKGGTVLHPAGRSSICACGIKRKDGVWRHYTRELLHFFLRLQKDWSLWRLKQVRFQKKTRGPEYSHSSGRTEKDKAVISFIENWGQKGLMDLPIMTTSDKPIQGSVRSNLDAQLPPSNIKLSRGDETESIDRL